MKRRATRLAFVYLFGAIVAFLAFTVTSRTPLHLGSPCREHLVRPGFSPWTGEPHGLVYIQHCDPENPRRLVTLGVGELAGRWAVPLPVGLVLGVGLGVLLTRDRTPRVPPGGPVAPTIAIDT